MTYKTCNPLICRTNNPIHTIKRSDVSNDIWEQLQLWLDLEQGSEDPLTPLTPALRFNLVQYLGGKRKEDYSFKITNKDTLNSLIKALKEMKKRWPNK